MPAMDAAQSTKTYSVPNMQKGMSVQFILKEIPVSLCYRGPDFACLVIYPQYELVLTGQWTRSVWQKGISADVQ